VFAKRSKISLEMAARKLRHQFLARIARERKIATVALAHHADDQVELFFLRLLRGTGGEGLAGMKWKSPSPADPKRSLVRPMLGYTKAELLDFAVSKKIAFREDTSNSSPDFLRNRIRNELLPMLRKNYQPAVEKTVLRLMDIVGAEAEFVGQIANADTSDFAHQSVAVQRRILQARLTAVGLSADFDLIESLRATPEKFVSINLGLSVARDAMGRIQWRTEEQNQFDDAEITLNLRGGAGRVNFDGTKFEWKILLQRTGHLPRKMGLCEFFDADRIGGKIILRHWHAGDRFQPIGMQSPVKLQDLFTNAKIAREQRHDLIIASVAGGEIFWVEGLRISENFKLTPDTKRKLVWRWSK
jgi:tRNA(Ile)-lysidine synthase